jgi:hypothetical protein
MSLSVLIVATAAALVGGCDISQRPPQTANPAPRVEAAPESGSQGASRAYERSMRLIGPGVTRDRQIRV